MMDRRRAIIAAQKSGSEWDSEWYYTDGFPTVAGWMLDATSGTNSNTMKSNGLQIRNNRYLINVPIEKGTVEATFKIENTRSEMAEDRANLRIGNSQFAIGVAFKTYSSENHVRLVTGSSANTTANKIIGDFVLGQEYTLKITIDGSSGTIEVNGVEIYAVTNTSLTGWKGTLLFGSDTSYGGAIWKSVKYKKIA